MNYLQISVIILAITVLLVYAIDTIGDIIVIRNLKKMVNTDMVKIDEILKQLKDIVEKLEGVDNG
jgi:hypothetical protein